MVIYKITNLIHGRVYIGQTIQSKSKARWYSHCDYARKGHKSHLYDSMRKHGLENFNWEIIDCAESVEQLNKLEAKWLTHYRSMGKVYNNREAGGNKLHSAESIERMRKAKIEEHARRRAEGREGGWKRIDGGAMKGKAHPGKGKKRNEKQRERIKSAINMMLQNNREEYCKKLSEAQKKRWAIRKAKEGIL